MTTANNAIDLFDQCVIPGIVGYGCFFCGAIDRLTWLSLTLQGQLAIGAKLRLVCRDCCKYYNRHWAIDMLQVWLN